MDIKDILELAKDPEGRVAVIQFIAELKEELYPVIFLLKETLGRDADSFVDEILHWSARKQKVSYDALVGVGFTSDEALSLVINQNIQLAAALRNAKS